MGFWDERRQKREERQAEKQREREEFEARIREKVAREEEERKRKAEELEAEKKRLLEQADREREEKRAAKRDARIQAGMKGSRATFREKMNVLLKRGPAVDEDFWEGLEEVLIMSDMGVNASVEIVAGLRETAARQALPDAYAVYELLADQIARAFPQVENDPFSDVPSLVLFVGINGAGKTTTVGKLAYEGVQAGRKVILGSADTFRNCRCGASAPGLKSCSVNVAPTRPACATTPSSAPKLPAPKRCSSIPLGAFTLLTT